jgi:uncharacterized phage protein gp47/JayE
VALLTDDPIDFVPLFADQDEATIRERWVAWANEGIAEEQADQWVDTREGFFWHVVTILAIREAARIYDAMGTEVVMAGIPLWSFDTYLDDWGETRNVERLAATAATGEVTFTNTTAEVITIDVGTEVGVEPATQDADAPSFQTTEGGDVPVAGGGSLTLPIRATENGSAGNVASLAIRLVLSEVPGVEVYNTAPTVGGTDPQDDEGLRKRVLESFEAGKSGNAADYRRWSLNYPGVGRVTVVPIWDGPGTVRVIVSTADGDPVSDDVVDGLQQALDPVPGKGAGIAPVGHIVTVSTATVMELTIAATIEFETGYSLDGAAGTTALGDAIEALVRSYVEKVEPGGEVVLSQVAGRIVAVPGVHDVGDVTIAVGAGAPAAANVPVPADPPEVPAIAAFALTEGSVP